MGKQSKARPSPDNPRARLQAVEGQILEPELPRRRVTLVKTSWPMDTLEDRLLLVRDGVVARLARTQHGPADSHLDEPAGG